MQHPTWLTWLDQCPSTNSWAIAHAAQLGHGDVVFTPQQTAGRGQQGRVWRSPPGVLTASIILDQPPAPGLSLGAGLAVVYAIETLVPDLQPQIKWPNDIYLEGRKLAGILCEGTLGSGTGRIVVGVGLNRCAELGDLNAISLHEVAIAPDEGVLLERIRHFLLEMASLWRSQGITPLLPALRQRDFLIGKRIAIEAQGETIWGEAIGMGDQGELRLRLDDGTERAIFSGHVRLNY
jgi:BirA family transcriptional regulator, biotin operon repressor / biotin---[acetyl-CoA-carboxylase] ligase